MSSDGRSMRSRAEPSTHPEQDLFIFVPLVPRVPMPRQDLDDTISTINTSERKEERQTGSIRDLEHACDERIGRLTQVPWAPGRYLRSKHLNVSVLTYYWTSSLWSVKQSARTSIGQASQDSPKPIANTLLVKNNLPLINKLVNPKRSTKRPMNRHARALSFHHRRKSVSRKRRSTRIRSKFERTSLRLI